MITITVPGTTTEKVVEVGGGVQIKVEGTLYMTMCEVVELDESSTDDYPIKVKGIGFEGWIRKNQITDALDKSAYAIERALNVVGNP